MFKENINSIVHGLKEFKGSGGYLALFAIGILYIFLKEKDRKRKALFMIYPLLMLFIWINPLFNKVVFPIFNTIYWRLLWLLPLGIEIAYCAVSFINEQNDKFRKCVVAIGSIITIMLAGQLIYTKVNFSKVGNLYKLPDECVHVAQLLGADDEEYKKAIAPIPLLPYISQIDASVHLSNKREAETYSKVEEIMAMLNRDIKCIVRVAEEKKCNYVIFEKAMVFNENIEDYGFKILTETDNYIIYKDMEFDYTSVNEK